jgi:hypothetical protein
MFDELQASKLLQALSLRRPLTELDAARALSSAARLLSADLVTTTSAVRVIPAAGRRATMPPVVRTAQPPAV